MLHGTVDLGEYIKFGVPVVLPGIVKGDTITLDGYLADIAPVPFDARGLVDHPGIKRGAAMSISYDDGREFHGVVTGRYRQRDGTVHAWGVINP